MNKNLVDFRKSKNKTIGEMSEVLDVSTSFYSKVEMGIRNPSYNFICKFLKIYPEANINQIFFDLK